MIHSFQETSSLDSAPGRGRRSTEPLIVEEDAFAIAEAIARSLSANVSSHSVVREMNIPLATVAYDFN